MAVGLYTIAPVSERGSVPEDVSPIESSERKMRRAAVVARYLFEREEIGRGVFASLLGKDMVKHLGMLDSMTDAGERVERLDYMHKFLGGFVTGALGESYESFRAGFLGEYACGSCLVGMGYKVRHSTLEEDTKWGVDLKVDLGKQYEGICPRFLAVQVKTLSMKERPQELLFPLRNQDDISRMCDNSPFSDRNLRGVQSRAEKLLEYTAQLDKVLPVVVILPSGESDSAIFNALSGTPTEEMGEVLGREIKSKILVREVEHAA